MSRMKRKTAHQREIFRMPRTPESGELNLKMLGRMSRTNEIYKKEEATFAKLSSILRVLEMLAAMRMEVPKHKNRR